MPEPEPAGTALDDETLAAWRAEAAAAASPFIDPVLFRRAQTALTAVGAGWLERVTGHPVPSWTHLTNAELALALRAADADAGHLHAARDQEHAARRAAGQQRAEQAKAAARSRREAWEALRAILPVPVDVWHNWTARHCDGYEQGANHIVVRSALRAGRLNREEGQPLCWTPSRARELRYVEAAAQDERNLPDCKACLRHAANLAVRPAADRERQRAAARRHPSSSPASRSPSSRMVPGARSGRTKL